MALSTICCKPRRGIEIGQGGDSVGLSLLPVAEIRLEIINVVTRREKEAFHTLLLTKFSARPSGDGSYYVQCEEATLPGVLQEIRAVLSDKTEIRVTNQDMKTPPLLTKIDATLADAQQEEEKRSRQVF